MSGRKAGDWKAATPKKPNKPRPAPVVALTDDEREARAEEALAKAALHLAEAEAMAPWGGAPNACVHAAYYALYFVAVAALFRAGGVGKRGGVPDSHEHVLQHYIALAERQDSRLNETGRLQNRVRDMRVEADYFGNEVLTDDEDRREDITAVVGAARAFMDDWKRLWAVQRR